MKDYNYVKYKLRKNDKIISEIGINHNGDLNLAKKMIQDKNLALILLNFKRDLDLVYSKEVLDQKRESPWAILTEIKKGLEFK